MRMKMESSIKESISILIKFTILIFIKKIKIQKKLSKPLKNIKLINKEEPKGLKEEEYTKIEKLFH
jgi:hypothetical protein